jgi:hypothetical protein
LFYNVFRQRKQAGIEETKALKIRMPARFIDI